MALSVPPLHRLLDPDRTGPAGATTRRLAETAWSTGMLGTGVLVVAALLLGRILSLKGWVDRCHRVFSAAAVLPGWAWGSALGAVTFLASSATALVLFRARPTSVDEMVQLLHAQALAAGRMGWPLPDPQAAWSVANGVMVDGRWSAIAAPGQTALLALGLLAEAAWLVGPLCAGVTAAFTALGLRRLWRDTPALAHAAGLLAALSPFVVLLGGTHLSHTGAAAFAALVFWSALRARDGSAAWGLLTGAAAGAMVLTRPWTGLVLGAALPAALWLPGLRRGTDFLGPTDASPAPPKAGWLLRRVGSAVAGGLPLAMGFLLWNRVLYGDVLRLGYTAAFGDAHGLGFHADPWGNHYGPLEALAYTASDLSTLGTHLLESPLSPVLLVGAALVLAPRWPRGTGVLLAWAGAALVGNALYWHHGQHLGPRFLYETAPAWAALTAAAVHALHRTPRLGGAWLRWTAVLTVAGMVLLLPQRVRTVRTALGPTASVPSPPAPAGRALVLVHGSWSGRVAARLVQTGVRRDSVETALRRNGLCRVHLHARARLAGAPPPPLDWRPATGSPASLQVMELSPGNRVRLEPGPLPPDCAAEARADARSGTLELVTLLWQAPPDRERPTVLARDLGPVDNRAVLEAHPDRTPWVALPDGTGGIRLLPYAEGMARLWGPEQGEDAATGG